TPIMTDSRQDKGSSALTGSDQAMTSSLLERLKVQDPNAWQQLVRLYYPLVRTWCLRSRLQAEDAADVAQEVFRTLSDNVARFERDGGANSFRGWLWGVTKKHLLAHWRRQKQQVAGTGGSDAQQRLAAVADPVVEEPSALEAASDRTTLVRRALAQLRS